MKNYWSQIVLPKKNSHKGENGRVLVIGGSQLFHAASFWAAAMASKIVDMVHFSSPAMENNELMRVRAKAKFWEGIVVPWEEVEHYIQEDDCILIGPGMTRSDARFQMTDSSENTRYIVNYFLKKYPEKKWVVDGGALQEVNARLLNKNMIVTPNKREQEILGDKVSEGVTVLAKGPVDVITGWESGYHAAKRHQPDCVRVAGGSPGMTKGGTGDVLSGIVAGLYAKSPAVAACVVASQVNKRAGEALAKRVGPFFSASDLIGEVQRQLGELVQI